MASVFAAKGDDCVDRGRGAESDAPSPGYWIPRSLLISAIYRSFVSTCLSCHAYQTLEKRLHFLFVAFVDADLGVELRPQPNVLQFQLGILLSG